MSANNFGFYPIYVTCILYQLFDQLMNSLSQIDNRMKNELKIAVDYYAIV